MPTQVILLERIEKLGAMGDVVDVKPGYARNYLLPQAKALRATKSNIAYFETQKVSLEKANDERKKTAQAFAKNVEGLTVSLIRQAGEAGHLYGSVTSRDIAEAINAAAKEKIERNMVDLNQNFKEIGLFPVVVTLHPEVKVEIIINIARTEDEAKVQAKSGKAVIAAREEEAAPQAANDSKADLMEEGALEAEKAAEAEDAEKSAEEEAKSAAKSEARAAKKAEAKAEEEAAEGDTEAVDASAETAEDAPAEEEKESKDA